MTQVHPNLAFFDISTFFLAFVAYHEPGGLLRFDDLSKHPSGKERIQNWSTLFLQAQEDRDLEQQQKILTALLTTLQA